MSPDIKIPQGSPTKVLFLVWGFSVHAKRRIQIFIDDPSFDVAVVSTYSYDFENARNVYLTAAKKTIRESPINPHNLSWQLGGKGYPSGDLSQRGNYKEVLKTLKTKAGSTGAGNILRVLYEATVCMRDLRTLKALAKEFRPDVIFLQTLLYPSYLAYFLPRKIPLIITFWNGDVIWWAKTKGIDRCLKKQLVTYGIRRAKAVTVNSKTAYKACLEYGVKPEKVHLIRYPSLDMRRFKPQAKDEARRQLGINFEKVVLCPRGLGSYLNSDIIVESAGGVVKEHPHVLFLFVSGVGSERQWKKHKKRGKELGIESNLRWDGQVPWEVMPQYYNAADVMISISSNDSLPSCMLEAMACGVPVIMGDIPQIREWIADGTNGFLVEARDYLSLSNKILEVLMDSEGKVRSFVQRNLERVSHDASSSLDTSTIKDLVHFVAKSKRKEDVKAGRNSQLPGQNGFQSQNPERLHR